MNTGIIWEALLRLDMVPFPGYIQMPVCKNGQGEILKTNHFQRGDKMNKRTINAQKLFAMW